MAKLFWLVGMAAALVTVASGQSDQFSKYNRVEAYEARPNVLMMPRYTTSNQVCEIGFQKRLYSPNLVSTISDFSSQEIDELLDEFAPENVRGPRVVGLVPGNAVLFSGRVMTTSREYQNVVVRTYSAQFDGWKKGTIYTSGEIVMTITWKGRSCK